MKSPSEFQQNSSHTFKGIFFFNFYGNTNYQAWLNHSLEGGGRKNITYDLTEFFAILGALLKSSQSLQIMYKLILTIFDFKLYYSCIVVKKFLVLAQKQACLSMEWNRRPRHKPTYQWTPDFL